jgi:predicted regulator of Ras-like GTPase activity (Roadblock/LC7/MglB family)
MSATEVLLIDHDDMVLGLLRGSIIGKDPGADVEIARNKSEAYLLFQFHKFKYIFCDYEILSENDHDLLEHIHTSQDKSINIIVTFYGDPQSLQFGSYPAPLVKLPKPIDQRNLSAILSQLFEEGLQNQGSEIHLTEDTYKHIGNSLKELQRSTNARCIVVSNQDGRVLVQEGDTENIQVDALASLVSGSIISLEEVGHIFNDPTIINLAFREGAKSDLYVMNIGQRLMLIMIQDKSVISSKIGTVWYYARQAAITIDQLIKEAMTVKKEQKKNRSNNTTIVDELDKIIERKNADRE